MAGRFETYVTSQAFALTMSKPMIDALAFEVMMTSKYVDDRDIAKYGPLWLEHSYLSWSALERRGLIFRTKTPGANGRAISVTEEGFLVFRLLQLANLVPETIKVKVA